MSALDFLVRRDDLRKCKFVKASNPDGIELAPGQVLLGVDRFGFSANNVTYAVVGEMMAYWNFFPAEPGWGRIPVWGFADVVRSRESGLPEGERVFGYFPMSTHLVVQAGHLTSRSFVDASPHRSALPAVYNQYTRVADDLAYDAGHEEAHMLLWPLFATSFLLDDLLADEDFFGARTVVIASASSKTAIALAFLLHRNRSDRCRVVGLTSPGNVGFVEGLGFYDQTLAYDAIPSLSRDEDAVFVDMAGDGAVTASVHRHLGDRLRYSSQVGLTHWEGRERQTGLPGPEPVFFFAPARAEQRGKDWGPGGLQQRLTRAWRDFVASTGAWLRVAPGWGPEAVERTYLQLLEGRMRPEQGHVLSLREAA